jgi:GNAT superfamily N-acetyltransferase
MLQPAHVGHLALLRALIREGASEGSFDRGLAAESTEAGEFFEKLKRALVTGYFVEQDARTGRIDTVAVPGYVFWPDDRHSGMPPVGFGLFRALDNGYELWLAGLEFARRGGGHGRALLEALFATPPGQRTHVLRVQRASRYVPQVTHLLESMGFTTVGDTARLRWFLRNDAPPALAARIREAVSARKPVN